MQRTQGWDLFKKTIEDLRSQNQVKLLDLILDDRDATALTVKDKSLKDLLSFLVAYEKVIEEASQKDTTVELSPTLYKPSHFQSQV